MVVSKVQPVEHLRQRRRQQWQQPEWKLQEQVRSAQVNILEVGPAQVKKLNDKFLAVHAPCDQSSALMQG